MEAYSIRLTMQLKSSSLACHEKDVYIFNLLYKQGMKIVGKASSSCIANTKRCWWFAKGETNNQQNIINLLR